MNNNDQETKVKKSKGKGIAILIIIIVVAAAAFFAGMSIPSEPENTAKSTKLTFEDIGELATQAAYCTTVGVIDNPRKFFKIKVPGTTSTKIYSYDYIIKAGMDFSDIEWDVDEADQIITVSLPKVKILSTEIKDGSFVIYYEDESIFNDVTLEDTNISNQKMKKQAQRDAKANGLYEEALENAKTVIKGFFACEYDMDVYKIKFEEQ